MGKATVKAFAIVGFILTNLFGNSAAYGQFAEKEIIVAGGITYMRTVTNPPCCEIIANFPIVRSPGSQTLGLTIMGSWRPGCLVPYEGCQSLQTNVFVLGALEPGNYSLRITDAWGPPQPLFPMPVFSITNTPEERTLTVSQATSTNIEFQVAGVPEARYFVQTSTTLLDWVNIRTNIGAPFTHVAPLQSGDLNRYYRVKILGNWEITGP
jgi:hypothetical protein